MEDNQPGRSSLERATVTSLPNTLFYVPEFISATEESQLLQDVLSQPRPKWTVLSRRRLQTHPSALTQSNVLLESPLPTWLSKLIPRMKDLGIWDASPHRAPNHVLINEYNPNEGIMPHRDGAAYHPVVATVSLGAPIVLDIYENTEGGTRVPKWRILQEPRR
jgi:alkylated DNA repair protein alkB family protein 6